MSYIESDILFGGFNFFMGLVIGVILARWKKRNLPPKV